MSYLFGGTRFDGYAQDGRRALNFGGGGGGGQQTSTGTTYQTNIPAYLEDPTKRMVARGETLSEQGYQPYAGERVAGFNPMQTQAFSDLGGMGTPSQFGQAGQSVTGAQQFGAVGALGAMGYQPTSFNQYQMSGPGAIGAQGVYGTGYDAYGVQAAPDVTGTGYDASQAAYAQGWTPAAAAQYMSPYQQAVTDIAKREATTEAAMLNRQLAGQAAKAGAFGGSRFGVEQALLGSRLATNLSDIQTKGLQDAYTAGLGQFNTEQGLRQNINLANQAAINQAGQFSASQAQAANLSNQQMRQQANLASQQAYNQALQFGATQAQAAQIANQAANLQASQANQQMQYQTGVQNLQSLLQTQQQQDAARQAAANLRLQGAQFGAQTGLSAAERLGQLGSAEQAADLQRIAAQQSAGAQQQALEQQKLDTAYQQAIEQRDWEKNQLGFLSGLIRGTPFSTNQLQTTTAPGASTTSQIAALGLGAYGLSSLLGKKEGGAIKGYAKGGSVEGYADGGGVSAYTDAQLQAIVAGKMQSLEVTPPDAERELRRRSLLRTAVKGVEANQTLSRTRAELPEEAGVAALPAENMGGFADGGIVGYAEGGDVERYQVGGSVVFNGIEYPIDPATGKVLYKGVLTDPKLLQQSAGSAWSGVKPLKSSDADYKPSTQAWLGAQDVERDKKYFADQQSMRENIASGKGINWKGNYYPIIQEGANAGKVDYKGVPTSMKMFPGSEGAVPAMPTATPWKSDSPAAMLAQAEAPAAPAADKGKGTAALDTGAGTGAGANRGAAPGSAAAGKVVQNMATQSEDPYERMFAAAERYRQRQVAAEGDPFADLRSAMAEQKAAYADMRKEGRGLAALQAAAAISQGGPGGTIAQLGRGLGALGEAGFKLQNQLAASRQADMASRVAMAQAEEARNRGLRGEAATLAAAGEQYGLQAAKLKQDYQLGMAQINASRASALRPGSEERLIQLLSGTTNPTPEQARAALQYIKSDVAGTKLSPEAINKSFSELGFRTVNPATKKAYTLPEWAAEQRRVYGSMASTPGAGVSLSDQLRAQAAAERQRRGI